MPMPLERCALWPHVAARMTPKTENSSKAILSPTFFGLWKKVGESIALTNKKIAFFLGPSGTNQGYTLTHFFFLKWVRV